MMQSVYINTTLCSLLILSVLYISYTRKFTTDSFQRRLVLVVMAFTTASVICDFIGRILSGIPGTWVTVTMLIANTLYIFNQNCTYYLTAALLDYVANRNRERLKKFVLISGIILAVYTVSVLFNLQHGFYFSINAENYFEPGKLYLLRLAISYAVIIVIILNIVSAINQFRSIQVSITVLFLLINIIGAGMDIIQKDSSLKWPCFVASLIYLYFFIIQFDYKLDALTGLNNRYSFYEFLNGMARHQAKNDYTIVVIEMDLFKEIKNTLGHTDSDNALKDLATIISGSIRHSDFAARYRSDKFVLAITAESDVQQIMDRIVSTIDFHNNKNLKAYKLHINYGYDIFEVNSSQSIRKLIHRIDKMIYTQRDEQLSHLTEKENASV